MVDSKSAWFTPHNGKELAASQPASQPIGIPIGNLTSQFFANIYLNGLDHFVKENLGCRYYLRYMDDFVLFHDDKNFLWSAKTKIVEYLEQLKLSLHENKCRVYKADCGVPFLGLVVFPDRRRLKRANVVRFKKRLKRFQKLYENSSEIWPHVYRSIRSWIGHATHANTMQLRRLVLENVVFRPQKGGLIETGVSAAGRGTTTTTGTCVPITATTTTPTIATTMSVSVVLPRPSTP